MIISLTAAVVVAAVIGVAVIIGRRRRKQIDELMLRVEELEQRLAPGEDDRPPTAPMNTLTAAGEGDVATDSLVTADVLAGWTTHIGRMLTEEGSPRDLADQALIRIHRRIGQPIQPSGLADGLNISLRTLERFLAGSLECSPGQLILAVKMREARRMLESGQFRVGEVAHHLAFSDAAHFSRRYRRFYHCPPSRHLP